MGCALDVGRRNKMLSDEGSVPETEAVGSLGITSQANAVTVTASSFGG